jgi:peptidoglycan/xylan/chitin deacetylase (PgdA/CDA1 family)
MTTPLDRTVVLDFDDYSVLRSRPDLLRTLKEYYPNLKVSMFTIPFDYEYETHGVRLMRDSCLKYIHENLDWIQIVPHGLTHIPNEFLNCDKETMEMALTAIDEAFKNDGLPYEKGFKAPYWLWNKNVVDVLDEHGWWGAVDPNQPKMARTKKYYEYQWSIDQEFWKDKKSKVLKLHGHMTPPNLNNIEDCLLNILKLPSDTKFGYVTDYLCE